MSKPQRIVVIDDDSGNNILCKIAIKKAIGDFDVQTFTEAKKGLEYIRTEYPEKDLPTILLLDINMPLMTGWDVLDVLETYDECIKKQLSIFMLSSSIDPSDRDRAKAKQHVKGYLEKPLLKEDIQRFFE
jgi:CheY-like chemotaxis protein